MAIPEDLRVYLPRSLRDIVGDLSASEERRWVEVEGGGLPGRVAVGIDRTQDGRFIVTGLLVGYREHEEVTWQQLRNLRPATILSWIFDGFDPLRPAALTDEVLEGKVQDIDGADFDVEAWERDEDTDYAVAQPGEVWLNMRKMTPYVLWTELSTRRAGEPREESRATAGATDLEEFAEVYARHYALTPRKATQATAKEYSVSRATVIRRLEAARRAGLLPPAPSRRTHPIEEGSP